MKGNRTWSRRSIIIILFAAVVILALAIGLGVGLGTKKNSEPTTVPPTTGNGTTPNSNSTWWTPRAKTTWQIVLNETVGTDNFASVSVYDIDLFDNTAQTINALHEAGKKVICYFSAGSYEDWRPDANSFPKSVLGNDLSGWPGERWVNTNSDVVRNIMIQRLELAKNKSCDGVDPDNIDAYGNDNGLGLTQHDAINYIQFLATESHSRGMAVGLKNAGEIVTDVTGVVDWEVNEQCVLYNECELFIPFITVDKPVFHIEYSNDTSAGYLRTVCNESPSNFSTLVKHIQLDEWYETC